MKILKNWSYNDLQGDLCAFWEEETAISVVEIVFIIAVLIGVVVIFKEQLEKLVKRIMSKVTSKSDTLLD